MSSERQNVREASACDHLGATAPVTRPGGGGTSRWRTRRRPSAGAWSPPSPASTSSTCGGGASCGSPAARAPPASSGPGDWVSPAPTSINRLQFAADQVTREKVGVEVQGLAVFRVVDPLMAYRMLNFSFTERASEKLTGILGEMFVGATRRLVANLTVEEVLTRRKDALATEPCGTLLGGRGAGASRRRHRHRVGRGDRHHRGPGRPHPLGGGVHRDAGGVSCRAGPAQPRGGASGGADHLHARGGERAGAGRGAHRLRGRDRAAARPGRGPRRGAGQ